MKKDEKTEDSSNVPLFSFLLFGISFDKSMPKSKALLVMLFIFILVLGSLALF